MSTLPWSWVVLDFIKTVKQADLQKEDYWLWRVFVNGSWDDYQLIKQKYIERDNINISCRSGFQPKKGGKNKGELHTLNPRQIKE